jgi:hypothetical protein
VKLNTSKYVQEFGERLVFNTLSKALLALVINAFSCSMYTSRSALSDIIHEAEAERLISNKAQAAIFKIGEIIFKIDVVYAKKIKAKVYVN